MNISYHDKQAIIAFLNTLTDYKMITDPKFSKSVSGKGMRYRLILVLILFPVFLCSSQRLTVLTYRMAPGDSTKPVRSTHQYLGVQANQLLNQLFSLGNNNAVVTNPYLIIYSVNSARTGVGLNMGLGYTVHSTDDKSDPNTTRSTTISSFSTRVGVEKKSLLGKKVAGELWI